LKNKWEKKKRETFRSAARSYITYRILSALSHWQTKTKTDI
jgi:hypothetical protein